MISKRFCSLDYGFIRSRDGFQNGCCRQLFGTEHVKQDKTQTGHFLCKHPLSLLVVRMLVKWRT
jgi:hypothetical protein